MRERGLFSALLRHARTGLPALALVAVGGLGVMAQGTAERADAAELMGREPAGEVRDRALRWLLDTQRPDGSWGSGVMDTVQETGFSVESFYAWKLAGNALACMALRVAPETPEHRAALERGLAYLCETRLPQRGSDWDTDQGWGALYGLVACAEFAGDPRFAGEDWSRRIDDLGRRYMALLERLQSPNGGWAYYDDPIYSRRRTWDTSFCTALVLPSLQRARELGWLKDDAVLKRARRYVALCAMPEGAFAYDLESAHRSVGGESINNIKGSLGRTQVCNFGLHSVGEGKITLERVREGLENFFRHHRFLEVARLRPVPHEAYYANAGYFYLFGHYYAALAIELLPIEERESWHARLRPHLKRAQRREGFAIDFNEASYGRVAGTAYLVLALSAGLGGGR